MDDSSTGASNKKDAISLKTETDDHQACVRPSGINHGLDAALAAAYGIEEALLVTYFIHWINANKMQGINEHDGRTWTYSTLEDIAARYPYLNRDQVKRTIKSLVDQGVLIKGNYNQTSYDRTLWYAFKEESVYVASQSIFSKGQKRPMEKTKTPDGKDKNAPPIPITVPVASPCSSPTPRSGEMPAAQKHGLRSNGTSPRQLAFKGNLEWAQHMIRECKSQADTLGIDMQLSSEKFYVTKNGSPHSNSYEIKSLTGSNRDRALQTMLRLGINLVGI